MLDLAIEDLLAAAGAFDVMETLVDPHGAMGARMPDQLLLDTIDGIATSWEGDLDPLEVFRPGAELTI